jgi:hypothetical protein
MAGDAVRHLIVERLRRRDHHPLARGGFGERQRVAAFA